jgi:hypothetical protein
VCRGLAIAMQKLNRFEDSIVWAQKAFAIAPSNAEAHHAIGVARQALGGRHGR